jgi:hypothetical protein
MSYVQLDTLRNARIRSGDRDALHAWIRAFIGVDLVRVPVCRGHSAPFDYFADAYFNSPPTALALGPRGSGKSMMGAFICHLDSRFRPGCSTRIVGASEQQSKQIHAAIREFILENSPDGSPLLMQSDADTIEKTLATEITYKNKSNIKVLTASRLSTRGPHVPRLMLDEVDEMRRDIFSSAIGMAQSKRGMDASILMSSTWHSEIGLMGELIEEFKRTNKPFYHFCVFEVLEHCPPERSGPNLEKCPACPIMKWCHEDIDEFGNGVPRAKRSRGYYSIEDFIQKATLLTEAEVAADYLCSGPRSEGIWFREFSPKENVSEAAEYKSHLHAYVSIDYGVHTGSLAFQIVHVPTPYDTQEEVHIFEEYYSEADAAEVAARQQRAKYEAAMIDRQTRQRRDINDKQFITVNMDPAANSREAAGAVGIREYQRGGIMRIVPWPNMSGRKLESLRLVESFVRNAFGQRTLLVHPRCKMTIAAFKNYQKEKHGEVFGVKPKDPQHPWEEMIDALAGGLLARYPNGRQAPADPRRVFIPPARLRA